MPRGKQESAEQIIPKLRVVEVEVARGKTVAESVKKIGVTEQTYYRWKKKFGGKDRTVNGTFARVASARNSRTVAFGYVFTPSRGLTRRVHGRKS